MPILDDEKYLFNLLQQNRLLTPEQRAFVESRKVQQRQLLLRQRSARRKTDTGREQDDTLNFVDIIVSLNLDLLGKKGQLLTEELIIQTVAKDRPQPDVILAVTDGFTDWPKHRLRPRVIAYLTRKSAAQRVPPWVTKIVAEK